MNAEIIAKYYEYLDLSKSRHTLASYRLTIENYRKQYGDDNLTIDTANNFITKQIKQKGLTRSIIVRAYALFGLFKYGNEPDYLHINIPRVVISDNPAFLYPEDIDKIISEAIGLLKPLTAYSFDLALRFGEAANSKKADFKLATYKAKVQREKQRNPQEQVLDVRPKYAGIVKEYLEKRKDSNEYLFVTNTLSRKISINEQHDFAYLCNETLKLKDRSDSGEPIRFHILRHTRLTWMIANGKSIEETAKFAGHTSVTSTMKYLNLASFNGLGIFKKPEIPRDES